MVVVAEVRPSAGGADAGSLTLQAVIGLTTSPPISIAPGLLVALTFIAYCVARPSKRWDIFWAATVPQYGSMFLHDITDIAEWWLYAALIPVSALWAAAVEREADEERTTARKPEGAARPVPE